MKKIVKLLLLFVVPLLFVACSDDEQNEQNYVDLQIEGKSYQGEICLKGVVHEEDGTWYLNTRLEDAQEFDFHFDKELNEKGHINEGYSIRINKIPHGVSLQDIEHIRKTFTGKLTLYEVKDFGSSHVESTASTKTTIVYIEHRYHYVFDVYAIE